MFVSLAVGLTCAKFGVGTASSRSTGSFELSCYTIVYTPHACHDASRSAAQYPDVRNP